MDDAFYWDGNEAWSLRIKFSRHYQYEAIIKLRNPLYWEIMWNKLCEADKNLRQPGPNADVTDTEQES